MDRRRWRRVCTRQRLVGKADYLYVRLNNKAYLNPPPLGFAIRGNVPVDEHVLRIGLNYKFTNCFFLFSCGAVVANY